MRRNKAWSNLELAMGLTLAPVPPTTSVSSSAHVDAAGTCREAGGKGRSTESSIHDVVQESFRPFHPRKSPSAELNHMLAQSSQACLADGP